MPGTINDKNIQIGLENALRIDPANPVKFKVYYFDGDNDKNVEIDLNYKVTTPNPVPATGPTFAAPQAYAGIAAAAVPAIADRNGDQNALQASLVYYTTQAQAEQNNHLGELTFFYKGAIELQNITRSCQNDLSCLDRIVARNLMTQDQADKLVQDVITILAKIEAKNYLMGLGYTVLNVGTAKVLEKSRQTDQTIRDSLLINKLTDLVRTQSQQ